MKNRGIILFGICLGLAACDLQPKITALPDTVGEFITERYPTLLADPESQPEIYNSAATDYGVYASPELYGSSGVDDYVLYSSVDDYIVPPQPEPITESEDVAETNDDVSDDAPTDTEWTDTDEFASDDVLVVPDQQKPEPVTEKPESVQNDESDEESDWDKNANVDDNLDIPGYDGGDYVIVAAGDSLYSIGKKHNMTIKELAEINHMSEPYKLLVGQKLRLRAALTSTNVAKVDKPTEPKPDAVVDAKPAKKPDAKPEKKPVEKPVDMSRKTTTRVDVDEITVAPGDTLYSLSRRYSVPVNDLAVMNNLVAPFSLYSGQKLRVPDLSSAPVRAATTPKTATATTKTLGKTSTAQPATTKQNQAKSADGKNAKPQQKPASKPVNQKQATKQPAKQTPRNQSGDVKKKSETKKPAPAKTKQQTTTPKNANATTPAAKKTPTIVARSSSKFSWPVRGKILSNYGAKTNGLFNDGINIAATAGTSVLAAENGVVAYAGNEVKGMGNLVIVQHSDGWMTVYAHMDSMNVRRGTRVSVGQKIGVVGKTGKVDKPQLHFEVRKGTKAYNPISYLKK